MILRKIANIIQDKGIASLTTNLYVGGFQDDYDNAVCLFQESGAVQDYQSDYGSDWVGLQVLCRGKGQYAVDTAWDVHNAVSGLSGLDDQDYYLVQTSIQNTPAQYDIDDKGRRMVSAHYMYLITPKTQHNRILIQS